VLLAFGFFLSYEPSSWLSREPGKAWGTVSVRRWHRRVLGLAAALTVAFAAAPYYSGWVVRAVGQKRGLPMVRQQTVNARVVLAIEGMDCLMCAGGLQNSLRQIPGVRRAEVSYQDKQAAIEYDPSTVQPSRFVKVITESGFKVRGSTQVNN
jgi:copper chaperone CopZ